jgi:hypothetical protein
LGITAIAVAPFVSRDGTVAADVDDQGRLTSVARDTSTENVTPYLHAMNHVTLWYLRRLGLLVALTLSACTSSRESAEPSQSVQQAPPRQADRSAWAELVGRPDSASLNGVLIRAAIAPVCDESERPTSEEALRLYTHIAAGSEHALRAALARINCFDGGEAEDLFASVGMFFDKSPRRALAIISQSTISAELGVVMVRWVAPSSESPQADVGILKDRLRVLEAFPDTSYSSTRALWVAGLRNALRELGQPDS